MTLLLGEYALSAAMLTSLAVILAAIGFGQSKNPGLLRAMRYGLGLLAGLLSVSSWGLLKALLDDNFKLSYVAAHSEKALAFGYKVAAFWAGQEGSLLFWAWVLGIMGAIMAWRFRAKDDSEAAVTLATMAAVTGFFTCVMLFAGNPFELSRTHEANGHGLNPALQNLAMVVHPPMLFLGYAGFTAPFALMLGALMSGRRDGRWLGEARVWMVYSWTVLTVGILLGAQWAYVALGWGGYWAWDPVENASLLPWLTGTALLHSAVLADKRGMFKGWTAWLTAASFLLCIFGTYLTRSGVIQSVHSFEESPIGKFFLVFMGVITVVSVVTILSRMSLLRSEHAMESLASREGLFLAANVLLVVMTLVTLIGTVFPLISGLYSTTPVTVSGPFYNSVVLPMGLLLATLMSMGPIIGHGNTAAERASVKLAVMVVSGAVAAGITGLLGYTSPWAIFAAGGVAAVVVGVAIDTFTSASGMIRAHRVGVVSALIKVFTLRPRHWGAQLGHLGLAAIVAGVVGSSRYNTVQVFELHRGESAQMGRYKLTYNGLDTIQRPNHTAKVASVNVTASNGESFRLQPESRFYNQQMNPDQPASEVAIRFSLASDLYMTLAGWDDNGGVATIQVIINPLVNWIWIGGVLITLGGLICLIPSGNRMGTPVSNAAPDSEPEPIHAGHTARERRRARLSDADLVTTRR